MNSPEVKNARSRLDSLLTSTKSFRLKEKQFLDDDNVSDSDSRQSHSRDWPPKDNPIVLLNTTSNSTKSRTVAVEIRNKQFRINTNITEPSLYSLSRAWVLGEETNEVNLNQSKTEDENKHINNQQPLITKDINKLPVGGICLPYNISRIPNPFPLHFVPPSEIVSISDYLPRWKQVKRKWCEQANICDQRHSKSIKLLKEVHHLAQQTQILYGLNAA